MAAHPVLVVLLLEPSSQLVERLEQEVTQDVVSHARLFLEQAAQSSKPYSSMVRAALSSRFELVDVPVSDDVG